MKLSKFLATGLLGAVCASAAVPLTAGAQEGTSLRERIRQRLEERRAPATTEQAARPQAGLTELSISFKGQTRNVLVYAPSALREGRPLPLVVALHGGGGYAAYMADDERYGLSKKAESAGFIVVYPNGYSKFPGGKFATWNAGGCCGDARDKQVDDVGFIREVVSSVKQRFAVDAQRVFATGMSNGGMMSYRLACEAADVFRAVASVAGTEALADCRPSQPVAVLHIHAKNDDHVLFDGGAGQGAFRDESKVMNFVSVPATVQRWVQRDQCSPVPRTVLRVSGAYCERYEGCAGGAAVQMCATDDGAHSWPGAQVTRRGKEGPSQALSANDTIWTFFQGLPPR